MRQGQCTNPVDIFPFIDKINNILFMSIKLGKVFIFAMSLAKIKRLMSRKMYNCEDQNNTAVGQSINRANVWSCKLRASGVYLFSFLIRCKYLCLPLFQLYFPSMNGPCCRLASLIFISSLDLAWRLPDYLRTAGPTETMIACHRGGW